MLRPPNVLINDGGTAMLSDLGMYADIQDLWPPPSMGYLAPEILVGEDQIYSPASDVYALGGLVLEVRRRIVLRTRQTSCGTDDTFPDLEWATAFP